MTIGSVLNQIFRPAAHQLKMDARVARDAQRVRASIRALLHCVENSGFNVGHGTGASYAAKRGLDRLQHASSYTVSDIEDMRSYSRDIRRDMHLQLKNARTMPGGIGSWNRERANALAASERAADTLVHLQPLKSHRV